MAMDLNKLRAKKGMPIPEAKTPKPATTEPAPKPKPEPQPASEAKVEPPKKVEQPKKKPPISKADRLDGKVLRKGRLPDGSSFDVKWDATAELWKGRLVMVLNGEAMQFYGEHSGVFALLSKLDNQYRAVVRSREQQEAGTLWVRTPEAARQQQG